MTRRSVPPSTRKTHLAAATGTAPAGSAWTCLIRPRTRSSTRDSGGSPRCWAWNRCWTVGRAAPCPIPTPTTPTSRGTLCSFQRMEFTESGKRTSFPGKWKRVEGRTSRAEARRRTPPRPSNRDRHAHHSPTRRPQARTTRSGRRHHPWGVRISRGFGRWAATLR